MSKYEADEKHFEQDHVEFAENGGKLASQPQIEGNIQLIGNDGEVRLVPTPRYFSAVDSGPQASSSC